MAQCCHGGRHVEQRFFQDVDGLTYQRDGERLVAWWGPLSRVIVDYAVYVKFVRLVSITLFGFGRR